jgi:hypothetical protein
MEEKGLAEEGQGPMADEEDGDGHVGSVLWSRAFVRQETVIFWRRSAKNR